MPLEIWLAFVAASTALLLIPGPTVLLVLSYAMSQGRRVAIASAAGVAMGDLLAMSASLIGLGAIVLASATVFSVLKWIGALYLVYLGVQLLRANPRHGLEADAEPGTITARKIFGHTLAVTALNPKSIAFFIAFVPQFVATDRPLAPQFAILIATFVGLAALNVLVYALLADQMRARIRKVSVLRNLNRVGGVALIAMGLLTASLRRAT